MSSGQAKKARQTVIGLADLLRNARKRAGRHNTALTIEECAEALGVSVARMKKIESGEGKELDINELVSLAALYGISVNCVNDISVGNDESDWDRAVRYFEDALDDEARDRISDAIFSSVDVLRKAGRFRVT